MESQSLTKDEEALLKCLIECKETEKILHRWPDISPAQVLQAVGTSVLDQAHVKTNVATVTLAWLDEIAENVAPEQEDEEVEQEEEVAECSPSKRSRDGVAESVEEEVEEEEEQAAPKKKKLDLSDLLDMCQPQKPEESVLSEELRQVRSRFMLDKSPYRREFLTLLALGWFIHTFQRCHPDANMWRDVASHVYVGSSSKLSSDKRLRQAKTLYDLIVVHKMHRLRYLEPERGTVAALCAQKADILRQLQNQRNEWMEQEEDVETTSEWIILQE